MSRENHVPGSFFIRMEIKKGEGMEKTTYKWSTYLKFVVFSLLGIFVFFINVPFPGYEIQIGIWKWGAVPAQSNVIVSHLTNFLKAALFTGNFKAMPLIVWGIGVYSIVDLFILRPDKFWHTTKVAAIFAVFKIVGFGLLCFAMLEIYLGWHPGFMGWFLNQYHP